MTVFFVLAAHAGFTLLQASQIRPKNTTAAIVGNLLSLAVTAIAFWGCGYAFAIGDGTNDSSNFFLSHKRFFLIDATDAEYGTWFMEFLQAGLVVVIMNGGFVARMRFWLYPIIAIVMSGFLYPCVRHWTHHNEGWLKKGITVRNDVGNLKDVEQAIVYTDHFGAGSIHIMAGSAALIGTIVLAPRMDRAENRKFQPVGGQITPLMLIGATLAMIGLIVHNGSSSSLALVNNILAANGSALIAYLLKRTRAFGESSSTKALLNGALAGVVSVSCAPHMYHPYGGFVVGVVGGIAYTIWSTLLQACRVDDPTETVSVHFGGGLWAVLAGPLFTRVTGVLYDGHKVKFQTFGWHMLGGVAIFVWSGITVFLILLLFVCTSIAKYKNDRVNAIGLDAHEYQEPAYPDRDHYTVDEEPKHVLDMWDDKGDLIANTNGISNGGYEGKRAARNGLPKPAGADGQLRQSITLDERNYEQWKQLNGRYQ